MQTEDVSLNKTMHILLMESSLSDANHIKKMLQTEDAKYRYSLERVRNWEEFKKAFAQTKPDLILAGYKFPDLAGIGVFDILNNNYRQVPVIIVTRVLTDHQAIALLKWNVKDYVLKKHLETLPITIAHVLSNERNISVRKNAEQKLIESEEKFRSIFNTSNDAILLYHGEHFFDCNKAALAMFQIPSKAKLATMHPADLSPSYQPNGKNSRSFADEITREALIKGEYRCEWQFRRLNGGTFPGDLLLSSFELNGTTMVQGTVRDISERKELENQLEQHNINLRNGLIKTIQAFAYAVATRDPYTATHERRVADLATAIATEMNLSKECIRGIHLAASIHDVGKLRVPLEILIKPGKITELEFAMIKLHSQAGYNILKDITFPWPIAEVIYQHHERLDGSGYPNGLKAKQILLETRIVSVADVVESMNNHRPYRPALGIEAALEEVNKNKGKLYDADIVELCTKLFRENKFEFAFT